MDHFNIEPDEKEDNVPARLTGGNGLYVSEADYHGYL